MLDENTYEKGTKVSDAQIASLNITAAEVLWRAKLHNRSSIPIYMIRLFRLRPLGNDDPGCTNRAMAWASQSMPPSARASGSGKRQGRRRTALKAALIDGGRQPSPQSNMQLSPQAIHVAS